MQPPAHLNQFELGLGHPSKQLSKGPAFPCETTFDYRSDATRPTAARHIAVEPGDPPAPPRRHPKLLDFFPLSGSQVNVNALAFTNSQSGAKATQVANAGALYETAIGTPAAIPGLLLVVNGQLALTSGAGIPGGYAAADASVPLTNTNPADGADWTGWTVTTALVNNLPALYARNTANGELWYYSPTVLSNLAAIQLQGTNPTPTAPVKLASSGWTALDKTVLQAADINGDGTADLWAVDSTGKAAPYLLSGTTLTGNANQGLFTPTHTWQLNDSTANGTTATTAKDSTGNTPLTGQSGATWNTSDIFSPDVHFNGTSSAVLSAGSVLDLTQSFTVSVWAKAGPNGGVMVSQDGTQNSGFMIYAEPPGGQWKFCMSRIDNGGWNYDCANAGSGGGIVQAGIWTHLTATYNRLSNVMALYINGIAVGSLTHTPVSGFNGSFRVGDFGSSNGGHFAFFNGAISNVQVWNGTALSPTQSALLSGTPGYVLFPADDTNYNSGSNWSAAHGNLSFTGGQLKITQTGWANGNTWTAGPTGYPNAVLSLQRDGNLVIYPTAAKTFGSALWASGTYNNGDDCMFLQPDGNLVIYRIDGVSLWSSSTYN
ncbi:LamG-like jellyroll fold domain-containing protein [Kitasatospora sp. P5_F3]